MASLVVPCPKCAAKLAAPESAVGKQIRCPKCGAIAVVPALVPAEEVPVVEAKVTPAKPKPAPDTSVTCCLACNSMIATIGKPPDGVVRCPKCGLANAVRNRVADPDDADDEAPRKKPKVRAAAVDDDDEDEDDRPRRKKRSRYADDEDDYGHDRRRKKPKRKAGGGALVAGLVVGGLLLLCVGVGVAVYAFGGKGSVLAKKAPVPPGWEEHNYPQDGFRAYMPKGASYTSVVSDAWRPGGFGGPRFGGRWDWDNNLPPAERVATLTSGWNGDAAHVDVYVVKFRDRVPAAARDALRRGPSNAKFGGVEMRTLRWLGHDAVEQAHAGGVTRVVYADRHAVVAVVTGPNAGRAKPEEEAAFFDNFELTD